MKSIPLIFLISLLSAPLASQPFLANGVKIGEVTQDSAVVWMRLSALEKGNPLSIEQAAPAAKGYVSIAYRVPGRDPDWSHTDIVAVNPDSDATTQIRLEGLNPGYRYEFKANAYNLDKEVTQTIFGSFQTAYASIVPAPVRVAVVSCQGIGTQDDPMKGHLAYREMLDRELDFFVHTGDIVYYDKDYEGMHPLSKNVTQARQRWNRMFAYHWNQEFHNQTTSYFIKDDHDTLKNDCWPGQTYGDLAFDEGLALFKEQVPSSPLPYRTFRWGKDLQVWMVEGRDYRDPNPAPDNPDKTLLGQEQKAWLKKGVLASDATFKIIISPSPIVGPDKEGKKDSLANYVYQHEGDEIRAFLSSIDNVYTVCGDRHWQYASKDPKTGLIEFGSGPINNEHALIGGNSGLKPEHLYFGGEKGGYLLMEVERMNGIPTLTLNWMNVDPSTKARDAGNVNHTMSFTASGS